MPLLARVTRVMHIWLLVATGLLTLPATVGAGNPSPLTVSIEQNGLVMQPDKSGTVTLQRAPFSIVVTFPGEGVSLSASPAKQLMKLAQKHRLDEPFSNAFKAFALDGAQTLNLSPDPMESYAYYSYSGPDSHAFSEVKRLEAQTVGRLNIEKIRPAKDAIPVGEYAGFDLYLVFAATEAAGRGQHRVAASDFVHIQFAH